MGGSSGGGNKKRPDDQIYSHLPTTQTFEPTLPGFDGLVAGQLQQGFGGLDPQGLAKLLENLYSPMTVYQVRSPTPNPANGDGNANGGSVDAPSGGGFGGSPAPGPSGGGGGGGSSTKKRDSDRHWLFK